MSFKMLPLVPEREHQELTTTTLSQPQNDKMSFKCPNCTKKLSKLERLKSHLAKKIPCNLKCRNCGIICRNTAAYKYHQKTQHPSEEQAIVLNTNNSNNQQLATVDQTHPVVTQKMITPEDKPLSLQEIDEMRQKMDYYIPMEDFDWNYLKSIADKVEVTETYYNTVSKKNSGKGSEVEKIQGIERRTKLIFRAENAKQCLPTTILSDILECLNSSMGDLSEMVYKLLNDVHAQRAEPRLLTIRGNDINRKSVSIYSRPPPTDDCYWIVNSNNVALKKTRDHCDSLFKFTLVSAIESLYPAMTLKKRKDIVLWYVSPYKFERDGKILQKAVTLRKDREDDDALYWEHVDSADLIKIDVNEPNQFTDYLALVKNKIDEMKEYILERLTKIELDDIRLNEFFELAKDASTGLDVD